MSWCLSEADRFATGSVDAEARLWDLRAKDPIVKVYRRGNHNEVRDIKFRPHHPHQIAIAYENGDVLAWDERYPDKPWIEWPTQALSVLAINWSPF